MVIKIQCPVCNARNELTQELQFCRRCQEDLSLLYQLKGYSYKFRLYAAQQLSQGATPQLRQVLLTAAWLCREK